MENMKNTGRLRMNMRRGLATLVVGSSVLAGSLGLGIRNSYAQDAAGLNDAIGASLRLAVPKSPEDARANAAAAFSSEMRARGIRHQETMDELKRIRNEQIEDNSKEPEVYYVRPEDYDEQDGLVFIKRHYTSGITDFPYMMDNLIKVSTDYCTYRKSAVIKGILHTWDYRVVNSEKYKRFLKSYRPYEYSRLKKDLRKIKAEEKGASGEKPRKKVFGIF